MRKSLGLSGSQSVPSRRAGALCQAAPHHMPWKAFLLAGGSSFRWKLNWLCVLPQLLLSCLLLPLSLPPSLLFLSVCSFLEDSAFILVLETRLPVKTACYVWKRTLDVLIPIKTLFYKQMFLLSEQPIFSAVFPWIFTHLNWFSLSFICFLWGTRTFLAF